MNKNLIALAVAAATISSAATAAEVYSDEASSLAVGGRFEARALMADTATDSNKVSDKTRVRINVAGKTDISDGLYGTGFFEKEFQSADSSDDETRYAYAGIGGTYGRLVYGKADGSLGMLTDYTDIMSYHGNEAGNKLAAADRTENNLSYVGSFDLMGNNLTVKTNYVFDNGDNKDGYSLGAQYVMDMGLGFGLGYGEQDSGTAEKGKQLFGAISYTIGDFYFAGLYQDAENTSVYKISNADVNVKESSGYEFAASYTMGKTVFIATYNYLEDSDKNIDLRDSIAVDATHYFNKNFRAYASYKFNNLDENATAGINKAATSDEFVLGARYDF
ncbi:Outer membrane protein OmpU [Photobacterium marinum]|uniref:Outer membrane protein OmpU n=1 Tax=Photobacterium marinum TaxID=1056511 RepID=L8JBI1_9GAMM|nr:porin [Photobacterium marinum]ELR66176.1 Outer membrane protein OmpU [Photobacterium marinum]